MIGDSHLPMGGPRGEVRRPVAFASAVVGGLLLALCPAATAHAVGRSHTATSGSVRDAYWWQPEPVTGLIPAPGVPAGGLYVASSPSGPQAESALSITTPIASGLVRLTLHVAQREVINAPGVAAFPAASHWQTGGPQPWSSRPSYRGATLLGRGTYDAAQTRMSLVLPAVALAQGIVLLPAATPHAMLGPTFAISFDRPLVSAVTYPDAPATRASHGFPPSPTTSATHGHRAGSATPTPTHSRHGHPSPSSRPRHRVSPTASNTSPAPPAGTSAPTPQAAASHVTRNVSIGVAIVAALITAAGASVSWRRRRPS